MSDTSLNEFGKIMALVNYVFDDDFLLACLMFYLIAFELQ